MLATDRYGTKCEFKKHDYVLIAPDPTHFSMDKTTSAGRIGKIVNTREYSRNEHKSLTQGEPWIEVDDENDARWILHPDDVIGLKRSDEPSPKEQKTDTAIGVVGAIAAAVAIASSLVFAILKYSIYL